MMIDEDTSPWPPAERGGSVAGRMPDTAMVEYGGDCGPLEDEDGSDTFHFCEHATKRCDVPPPRCLIWILDSFPATSAHAAKRVSQVHQRTVKSRPLIAIDSHHHIKPPANDAPSTQRTVYSENALVDKVRATVLCATGRVQSCNPWAPCTPLPKDSGRPKVCIHDRR